MGLGVGVGVGMGVGMEARVSCMLGKQWSTSFSFTSLLRELRGSSVLGRARPSHQTEAPDPSLGTGDCPAGLKPSQIQTRKKQRLEL